MMLWIKCFLLSIYFFFCTCMGASLENGMVRDISAIVFIILLILSFVLLLASDDDEPDVALGIINLTNWILRRG